MSAARCLSISSHATPLQAGADRSSCWESNILMWLLRHFQAEQNPFLYCRFDPALFPLLMTSTRPADVAPSDELLHPEAGARGCFSGTLLSAPPPLQPGPWISGQHLMMQRRYCASAAEQKSQRGGSWARAALEQRPPHSPALPPLGPLARRDELKPRAGSGNVMY